LNLLGIECEWRVIYQARQRAMQRVYKVSNNGDNFREGSINKIILHMLADLNIDFLYYDLFIQAEIEFEVSSVSLNKKLINFLENLALKNDFEIILVSDMYLSESAIRQILNLKEFNLKCANVYISSETSFTKASGELFDYLLSQGPYLPKEIIHIGDNFYSDYVSPKCKGMEALHLPRSIFWQFMHKGYRLINKTTCDTIL